MHCRRATSTIGAWVCSEQTIAMSLSTPKRKNGIHFEVSICINNKTFGIYVNIKFAPEYVAYADCMAATLISLMGN